MRKLILLYYLLLVTVCVCAQRPEKPIKPEFRPDWTYSGTSLPAENDSYVYVVEQGEGATKQEALNSAIARVLVTTCAQHGEQRTYVDFFNELQKGGDYKKINDIKISLNKSADFFVKVDNNTWSAYVIFQVQRSIYQLKSDICLVCDDSTIYKRQLQEYEVKLGIYDSWIKQYRNKMIAQSFVPGMAQIKKGSVGKGVGFICGEVVFVGGTIVSECLYRQYKNQINKTSGKTQQAYVQAAHICQITRNVCIAGIAATYIWNVIDGIVAKDYNKPSFGSTTFQFSPYVSLEDAGMAVNITF